MEFHRSRKQTAIVVINLLAVSAVAGLFLYDAWLVGGVFNWIVGSVFGLWALFILQNLIRRRVFMRVERHGLTINSVLGTASFDFEDLEWARLEPGGRICLFAYRDHATGTTLHTGVSQKLLGPEAMTYLRGAVMRARPDLPDSAPGAAPLKEPGA